MLKQGGHRGATIDDVRVANLPNNHTGNYGEAGIQSTESLLTANHIALDGFGHTVYKEVKGVVFAFLGFNGVGESIDTAEMAREIHGARRRAQVIVVSFHWGREYTPIPLTAPGLADQDPRMIGHLAVEAGANLVVGNHPREIPRRSPSNRYGPIGKIPPPTPPGVYTRAAMGQACDVFGKTARGRVRSAWASA